VLASWLHELWDRFPHLALTSPDGRCGKTRFLELLEQVCHKARQLAGITAAALFRRIELEKPTILLDEAQCLSRRGSELAEMLRDLFCAGISKDSTVSRCVGQNHDPYDFPIFCPKVLSLIGKLDSILADRCLPIHMVRKKKDEVVKRCRLKVAKAEGAAVKEELEKWAAQEDVKQAATSAYDTLEPFDIDNDRMAELLLPLQVVLTPEVGAVGPTGGTFLDTGKTALEILEEYAFGMQDAEKEADAMSTGGRLLNACREIFARVTVIQGDGRFLSTDVLISKLVERKEEPWATYSHDKPITAEALATLLRPYGIHSGRNLKQTARGYHASRFQEAWARYLPSA
jgi:hypothetical protein